MLNNTYCTPYQMYMSYQQYVGDDGKDIFLSCKKIKYKN